GLAAYILQAMRSEGVSVEEARQRILLVDRDGLVHDGQPNLTPGQRAYAQPAASLATFRKDDAGRVMLQAVLEQLGATGLLGLSASRRSVASSVRRRCGRWPRGSSGRSSPRSPTRWSAARRPLPISCAGRTAGPSSPPEARTRR